MIDINKLDEYLLLGRSFLGKDILVWCRKNKGNKKDIDISFAAAEIHRNYFDRTYIDTRNYYYIIYSRGYNGRLYTVVRDYAMSPSFDTSKPCIRLKSINENLNKAKELEGEIVSNNKYTSHEKNQMNEALTVFTTRIGLLGLEKRRDIKKYAAQSGNYKRYQIYNILKSYVNDLKSIKYAMTKVNQDTD